MDINSLQNWYIDSNSIQTHWRDPEYIFNWHWFWVSCRRKYSWKDTVQGHTCHRLRGSNFQIVVATFHYWLRINEIHVYGRGIKDTSCHREIKKTLTTGVFLCEMQNTRNHCLIFLLATDYFLVIYSIHLQPHHLVIYWKVGYSKLHLMGNILVTNIKLTILGFE